MERQKDPEEISLLGLLAKMPGRGVKPYGTLQTRPTID